MGPPSRRKLRTLVRSYSSICKLVTHGPRRRRISTFAVFAKKPVSYLQRTLNTKLALRSSANLAFTSALVRKRHVPLSLWPLLSPRRLRQRVPPAAAMDTEKGRSQTPRTKPRERQRSGGEGGPSWWRGSASSVLSHAPCFLRCGGGGGRSSGL